MGKILSKKIVLLSFMVLLFLAIYKADYAKADLLPTPDNDFFQKHSGECEYVPRTYISNGINGSVHVWESPGSHKVITTYPNNTKFNVLYFYSDDNNEAWGIFYSIEQNPHYGWLLLNDLQVEYDNISFCQEHKNEFKEYNGEFDNYEVPTSAPIILWSYPGSGKIDGRIKECDQYHSIVFTFTDIDGNLWGYYAYTSSPGTWRTYWGCSAAWICISDPTNEKIPIYNTTQPTIIPAANNMISITNSRNNCIYYVVVALIIITFLSAFIFIRFRFKQNSKKESS